MRGRRLALVGIAASVLTLAGVLPYSGQVAQGQQLQKQKCKTVKKNGHKVRVCTKAKPAPVNPTATFTVTPTLTPTLTPTATATETPTPTATVEVVSVVLGGNSPQPTATPSPTPTATPLLLSTVAPLPSATPLSTPISTATAAPVSRFTLQHDSAKGTDALTDTQTGVVAVTGSYEAGYTDDYGIPASSGTEYIWMVAAEAVSTGTFVSSYFNYMLEDASGHLYAPSSGGPPGASALQMPVALISPGIANSGWMEFSVPSGPGTYTVLWNEDDAIPLTPMAKITLTS